MQTHTYKSFYFITYSKKNSMSVCMTIFYATIVVVVMPSSVKNNQNSFELAFAAYIQYRFLVFMN